MALDQPIASLPVFIFDYARAPYDDWNRQAWTGAALVLVMLVTLLSACVRLIRCEVDPAIVTHATDPRTRALAR